MKKIFLLIMIFAITSLNAKNLEPVSYWDMQNVSNPKVSPSNELIVFSKRYIDKQNDSFKNEIWIMDIEGNNKRFFATGSSPKWGPDSSKIAFIKSDENDVQQIFVRHLNFQSESMITTSEKGIKDFAWSKDGQYFSFSSFNPYQTDWKIDIPGKDDNKDYKWTKEPNVVTTMHWKSDGSGEYESGEDHLYLINSDGGPSIKISSIGMDYVGDLQWVDKKTLLFTGNNTLNDLETSWKQSAVFTLNIENKKLSKISPEDGVYLSPKSSKNGDKIAFLGHPSKNYSSVAFDVWLHENNKNKLLTKDLPSTPGELFWNGINELIFDIDDRGSSKLISLNVSNKNLKKVIEDFNEQFYLSSVTKNTFYGIYSNSNRPGEIATISNGSLNKLSEFNELVLAQYSLGDTTEINFEAPDGTPIQGWYITPPDFDKSKKYPLILVIHGGPHAMYRPSFNYLWHQFASDGYVVLYTNPRGSTGYGSDFANVIDNDYPGEGDLSDLLAGVDFLTDKSFIDKSNMFVQGCSGGGVLTAWIVGHDDRFSAAASLCPVTNWISMVGTTDIPAWTFEWFDKPFWEDPSEWLDHSPIMRTGFVKTPTLFMTGVLDIRTPMAQTEEMYIAFKHAGVDTTLVRMNEEWHGTGRRKPTNWFRTYGYLSEWYEKYSE